MRKLFSYLFISIVIFSPFVPLALLNLISAEADVSEEVHLQESFRSVQAKFYELVKAKGIKNITAQDIIQNLDQRTLNILQKYYFDNGCPVRADSFEKCVERIVEDLKLALLAFGLSDKLLSSIDEGNKKPVSFICPINMNIKDQEECYREAAKQYMMLPILALMKDKDLKEKNWLYAPRIFAKELPPTQKLAVEGIGCALTNGNLMTVSNFNQHFVNVAFGKGAPYDIQSWFGLDMVDTGAPGCNASERDCGFEQNIVPASGEFYGLFQWLADQIEENLASSNLIQLVQGLLIGKGTCSNMAGVTMCLVVRDHTSAAGNQCYEDVCGTCNTVNDGYIMYYNRSFVEVFPDPTAGYLTAIIALWAENDSANIDPFPSLMIPGHNTIDSGNSRPSSEICFEARSCADGWTFGHGDTQFRAYVEGVLLRVRLQVVVQGSLVDVCAASADLDILGSDVDHPVLGCLTDCFGAEPLLEGLGPTIEAGIDEFLHGNCPIPGAGAGITDKSLSLCPKKPSAMPGSGPGGGNCSALLPACPDVSGTWQCCWNYSTGSMECNTGGSGGCKHGLLPIDLNEFLVTGRAFSVSQFCGRPTSAQDPPSGHSHEDPAKCYPGPVNVGLLSVPKRPYYGVLGCFSGEYDIGCYTYPHRVLVTGTGCSISFDAGIRAKDLSKTCYPGFMTRGIALGTNTSGFFPRPAFSIDNYSPFPFPDNALLTSRINSWILSNLTPTNWDNGYAQTGIGFNFLFYNNSYVDACISTNGYITLPQGNTGECTDPNPDPIPSTTTPDPYIAPLWADLSGDGNEFLYYMVSLPPLFIPRTQQSRQPGASWTGNNYPQVAIGWSGEANYYHLPSGNTEGNICENGIDFNNYVYAYPLPAGFTFPFYDQTGNNYLCIDSNGWVAPRVGGCGGVVSDPTGDPIPNAGAPNGIIAALWKDLDPAHRQLRGGGDCDGRCPECEDGCQGASCTTGDGVSWFCHSGQSVNCGWTYCSGGCTGCGTSRWCRNYDTTNSDVCCGANGDCSGTCNSNGTCSGTCYTVPGCVPDSGGNYDVNCRIGPCDGDECGCNQRNEHCHGTCVLVCTSCDLRCHSTGGAGGCYSQNQCCFWRGGGWECACASNQNCQGGCEADDNLFDAEPQQRLFRVLGAGYVLLGSIDKDGNGSPDPVDCPSADIADGVFDDDNDGNYYDDDSAAANCQAIVITWYKIPDFDAINDNGCGNDDNNDCIDTDEDCCSADQCSGGACQNCGPCDSDNRALCRLRAAGILNPEPSYGGSGPCTNKNTFQVVLFSDGTIDINLENWTNTNILIDPDGPGGSGCNLCGLCISGCDCAPKTNPRPHYVGIENYTGTQGIGIPNPRPNTTYRFIRVGYASAVCGAAALQTGQFTNCPDTLQPGVAPDRSCRVIRWHHFHVKGQAICVDMYALLYNAWTGSSNQNYDIVFYMRDFKAPIPGVSDPAQQSQIARQTMFLRTVGVENAAGTMGQYGFIPPDGTGIVMRFSPAFLYFVGMGVSQDLLSDAAQMIYSSGLMCLAVNPGGVLTSGADKYNDISAFLPFNLSAVENLAYFFNSVRYMCDPDSEAEIRFYPTGLSPASARTGTAWPSLLTPPAPGSGTPLPSFPSQFAVQPFSDFTFVLPNYAAGFWCMQNNLGVGNPALFRKDGIPGTTPVQLFEGIGDWFLAADIEYFRQDPSGGWLSNPPSRVTQVIDFFIDVKPYVWQINWNAAVPMSGRIGGISDILGDVLSGYLQAMLRTRVSFPLDITNSLHPVIKYIRPEGPDVTIDEFPDTTSWQLIETKYPWVTTMPDYLAIYVGCIDFNQNGVIDPIVECRDYSILGSLDLSSILNAFGGGFLSPVLRDGVAKPSSGFPPFEVLVGDKRCKAGEECYIGYDEAKRFFGDSVQNYVQVVYGGIKKISFRRGKTLWRVPTPIQYYSGDIRINTGVWLDGRNELSFFVIDEEDRGWEDIVKIKFDLDRLEPGVWIAGGNGYYDSKLGMRVFHSDKKQVLVLRRYDNMTPPERVKVSYFVGFSDLSGDEGKTFDKWEETDRLEFSLPKGIYRLTIKAKDLAGNESEFSEIVYVKGDEVIGCPIIGSITQDNIKVAFGILNSLIPVSVILFALYIMKAVKNGKNGNGGVRKE